MFGFLPEPLFRPCPRCGESIARRDQSEHVCEEVRRLAHEGMQIRLEAERFDEELATWLASSVGRFAVYYAERQRRAA